MVVESDGAATAVGPSDRPVLAEIAVVLGPQFVLGAIAVVVAVERLACVIRGVVVCEGFDDVELDEWVLGEAVEGEVGVAGGVIFRRVVDDTVWGSADVSLASQGVKRTDSGFLCSPFQRRSCLPDRAPSRE